MSESSGCCGRKALGTVQSSSKKNLTEQHSEKWLARTIQYLNDCKYFREATNSGLLKPPQFEEPTEFYQLPTYKWFLTAYVQHILPRIDDEGINHLHLWQHNQDGLHQESG